MKKQDMVDRLVRWLKTGKDQFVGQKAFAAFLVAWLRDLDLSHKEKYDFWEIDPYVPQLVVDAFEDMRSGTDERARKAREEIGGEIRSLTALEPAVRSGPTAQTIGFMLSDALNERQIGQAFIAYAYAERAALMLAFDRFLRLVYRRGLFALVRDESACGMSGAFGDTQLLTYVMAGRIMFTFSRGKGDGRGQVSFVAEDNDPTAWSAGLQSVEGADLPAAMRMINDVVAHWPTAAADQKTAYVPDKEVTPG